jgi:hypothetical protein
MDEASISTGDYLASFAIFARFWTANVQGETTALGVESLPKKPIFGGNHVELQAKS